MSRAAIAGAAPSIARTRILLVDDNEDGLQLLAELLEDAGHEIMTATSAAAALRVIDGFVPDAAILDIGLPGMDGYQLAAELHRRMGDATPPLIAVTGYCKATDRMRSRQAGFIAHLTKPVSERAMIAAIARIRLRYVRRRPLPAMF